jgi:putative PIN family toxin of toxin-antitoxin system
MGLSRKILAVMIAPVLSFGKMSQRVVLDTNVFVAALRSRGGASRTVFRLCLKRRCQPLMGQQLFTEFEDVLGRTELFRASMLTAREREELLDAFLRVCEWVPIFFLWRPNLPDGGDNHLVELAVAGMAAELVTQNVRDLRQGELRFPHLRIETPAEFMTGWRKQYGNDDDSSSGRKTSAAATAGRAPRRKPEQAGGRVGQHGAGAI